MPITALAAQSTVTTPSTVASKISSPASATTVTTTTAADTASISTDALKASDVADSAFTDFQSELKQVNNQINSYEHQVTWQVDNHAAITGPAGTASSNASTPVLSSAFAVQLIHTQLTSALGSNVSLKIGGSLGIADLSFAAGTKLSALAAAINTVQGTTGVSATASGATVAFDASASSASQFVTVSAINGTFNTVANTNSGATAQTIADGFSSIESSLQYPLNGLTNDQYSQLSTAFRQLNTEQTQFETFINNRTTPNYAALTHQLNDNVNSYEHQVTWDIDHGAKITAPNSLTSNGSAVSTGDASTSAVNPTLAQSISNGFTALEAATEKALGPLPKQQQTQFAQLQLTLLKEQTRFTGFAQRRSAYRAANPPTGANQNVSA
jgi:hypothetical protein